MSGIIRVFCFGLTISVFILLGFDNCACDQNGTTPETVILVSIAGLGWQYVGSNLTHTPNFDFVAETGVRAKNMLPVNPTRTAPIHMTFMTGLYPENHGIVDNMFWDPAYEEGFIHSDDCSNFDPKFYNESEPLWLTMEKQGERTASYFWPGSMSYNETPSYHIKPVCYVNCEDHRGKKLESLRGYMRVHCTFDWSDPFSNRVDKVLEWVKSDAPPRLVMLYIDEPDWKGHAYGPNSEKYRQMVEAIDKDVVGRLIDGLWTAHLLDKVNIVLVSDHSVIETSHRRQIRLNDFTPEDNYYGHRATSEQIWPKPGRLEEIYSAIKKRNNSHMKVYKKHEIPESLHWKNHRRIPPLYLAVDEGWLMRPDYDIIGEGQWTEGSHVWPPSQNSAAIFYARGPAFKKRYYSPRTIHAVDLYPLLCKILGIKPRANNGSLSTMMEFLTEGSDVSRNNKTHTATPTNSTTSVNQTDSNATTGESAGSRNSSRSLNASEGKSVAVDTSPPMRHTTPPSTVQPSTEKLVTQEVQVVHLKAESNGCINTAAVHLTFGMLLISVFVHF